MTTMKNIWELGGDLLSLCLLYVCSDAYHSNATLPLPYHSLVFHVRDWVWLAGWLARVAGSSFFSIWR